MRRLPRVTLAALAAAFAFAATPGAADAQIGGLIRKKIAEKAAERVVNSATGVQQAGGPRVEAVEFDETLLEITSPRVDAFLQLERVAEQAVKDYPAWKAEQQRTAKDRMPAYQAQMREWEAKRAAHDRERAAYDKASNDYMQCQMKVAGQGLRAMADPTTTKMMARMMAMSEEERDAFQKRNEDRSRRMHEAQARNDARAAGIIRDSLDADYQKTLGVSMADMERMGARGAQVQQNMAAEQQKCGPEPKEPEPLPDQPTKPGEVMTDEQYVGMRVAEAMRKHGLNEEQYAMLRERLEAFASGKDAKSGTGIYTESELKVLEARYDELKPALQSQKRFRF